MHKHKGSKKPLTFIKKKIRNLSDFVYPRLPFVHPPSKDENKFLKKLCNCEFLKKEALEGFPRQIQHLEQSRGPFSELFAKYYVNLFMLNTLAPYH